MPSYVESNAAAAAFRAEYDASLCRLLEERRCAAAEKRKEFSARLLQEPDAYRPRFAAMLGWPLTEYCPRVPTVRKTLVTEENGVKIYRLQLEIWPGFWFYGLLFLQPGEGKRPLVLSQHGGAGTPELCSSLLTMGSANYNEMTVRLLQEGVHVFAPQLFLWDTGLFPSTDEEKDKTRDEIRRSLDASFKNMGGSVMAVELTCLRHCLDYFETLPTVDSKRFGMCGLSYGGQYALFLPAADPRIRASLSSCWFNNRTSYEWEDYTWFNAGTQFLDAEIALLVHPRSLFLQVADKDPCFHADGAQKEWQRLQEMCGTDTDWVDFEVFDGEHEFNRSDRQISRLAAVLKK